MSNPTDTDADRIAVALIVRALNGSDPHDLAATARASAGAGADLGDVVGALAAAAGALLQQQGVTAEAVKASWHARPAATTD